MRHLIPKLLLLLAMAVPATSARAQGDTASQVEALYAEGVALYRAQKYTAAVEKFEEAYRLFPEPNLLFNIGKAKEASGDLDGAMVAYEKCAASSEATASTRAKATERASMLRTAKLKSKVAPSDAELSPAPAPGVTGAPVTVATNPKKSEGPGVLPWVVGGIGVALVGTGAVFFGLGASDHGKIADAKSNAMNGVAPLTRVEAEELADSGESKKTIGTALIAGGVVAAAGGAVWALLSGGDDDVAVSVAPGKDGGALVVGGRF